LEIENWRIEDRDRRLESFDFAILNSEFASFGFSIFNLQSPISNFQFQIFNSSPHPPSSILNPLGERCLVHERNW
jgi:hypothetical protein